MLELKYNFTDIKDSNLVFFIENISDLKLLKTLKLNKKIVEKINETIEKKENKVLEFYL